MARRVRKTNWSRIFQRSLATMTRTALRAGSKAVARSLRAAPGTLKLKRKPAAKSIAPGASSARQWSSGVAIGAGVARRYWLYKPTGVKATERLPLLVMLHGCRQDAEALAASSRMNRIATRQRFLVLYPEQDRLANAQACWNWFDTRSGRAQGEASAIEAAIDQVCRLQPVDPGRIALAGLSAGAGMAALLATRDPARYRAVAMHSGVGAGVANSSASALSAMRGQHFAITPLAMMAAMTPSIEPAGSADSNVNVATVHWPALLVIHGSADHIVAPSNGADAARLWAARVGAKAGAPRTVQRGARYAATITDYRGKGRIVATFCEVQGLGHAWSGGTAGASYSDPRGPDASAMIWAFVAKRF